MTSHVPSVTSPVMTSPKPKQSPVSQKQRRKKKDAKHMSQEVDLVFYDLSASQTPESPAESEEVSPMTPREQTNHRDTSSMSDYVSPMRGLGFPHADRATVMPARVKQRRAKQGSFASLPVAVEHSDNEFLYRAMTAERQQPGKAVMQASRDMRRTKTDAVRPSLSPIITPRAEEPWGPAPVTRQSPGSAGRSRSPPPAVSRQHAGQTTSGWPTGGLASPSGNASRHGAVSFQGAYLGGSQHPHPSIINVHSWGSLPKAGTDAAAAAASAAAGRGGSGPAGPSNSSYQSRRSNELQGATHPFKPVTVVTSKARQATSAQDGSHTQGQGPAVSATAEAAVWAPARAGQAGGQPGRQQRAVQKASTLKNPSPSTMFRAHASQASQASQASHIRDAQASASAGPASAAGGKATLPAVAEPLAGSAAPQQWVPPRRMASMDDCATGKPFFFPLSGSEDNSAGTALARAMRANVSPIRGVLLSALRVHDSPSSSSSSAAAAAAGYSCGNNSDAGSGNGGNPKLRVKVVARKSLGIHPHLMQAGAGAVTASTGAPAQKGRQGAGNGRAVAAGKLDITVPRASSTPQDLDAWDMESPPGSGANDNGHPTKKLERTLAFKEGSERGSLQSAGREPQPSRKVQPGGRGEGEEVRAPQGLHRPGPGGKGHANPGNPTGATPSSGYVAAGAGMTSGPAAAAPAGAAAGGGVATAASAASGAAGAAAAGAPTGSRFGQAMASGLRAMRPAGSPAANRDASVPRHSVSGEVDVQFGPESPLGDAPPLENIMRAMTESRRGGMKKKGYTDPFLSPRKVKFDTNVQVHVYSEEEAKTAVSRIPKLPFM